MPVKKSDKNRLKIKMYEYNTDRSKNKYVLWMFGSTNLDSIYNIVHYRGMIYEIRFKNGNLSYIDNEEYKQLVEVINTEFKRLVDNFKFKNKNIGSLDEHKKENSKYFKDKLQYLDSKLRSFNSHDTSSKIRDLLSGEV